jgi:hypothetical protein
MSDFSSKAEIYQINLRRLWRGEYSLASAFWGFYVLGIAILMVLGGLLNYLSRSVNLHAPTFIVTLILMWLYGLIATVGVWNAAKRSQNKIAAFLGRAFVLLIAARILWNLSNGGAVTLMNIATGRLEFDPN